MTNKKVIVTAVCISLIACVLAYGVLNTNLISDIQSSTGGSTNTDGTTTPESSTDSTSLQLCRYLGFFLNL